MARRILLIYFIAFSLAFSEGKSRDPYKVLGVDRKANQREIQKAFHRLSLQYHPDKNQNKGAQEKFAEINNAYDILSDEEKRKNYDLYGDEKVAAGFGGHNFGGGNYGGPNEGFFTSQPSGSHSFSFSFGGNPKSGGGTFDFGFNDLFSNFFGDSSSGGPHFGNFWGSPRDDTRESLPEIDSLKFKKEIVDRGLTWLILFYTSKVNGYHNSESLVLEVSSSLKGALKAGKVNCQKEKSLCSDHGAWPSKTARIFVYSYKNSEKGKLVEYKGELEPKNFRTFCQDQFPRFSTRHSLNEVDFSFTPSAKEEIPQVLLLSTKRETPVIWRVLSGLYRRKFKFHDAQVSDISDETVKRFKVSTLPAVVGKMSNGEEHVLKAGVVIKDLSSGIEEMKGLLDKFERLNRRKEPSQNEEPEDDGRVPLLTNLNAERLCSESTPLCIIGVFRSTQAKESMIPILSLLSRKTLTRRQSQPLASKDSVSYSLLDASKNRNFLESFDPSIFRSSDQILLAYKPRKGKFAVLETRELTLEEAESFIGSALNGDIRFVKIRQKPVLERSTLYR